MLSYVLTVCNGDVSIATKRVSTLTWYEEWFLYLEFVWGKSIPTVSAALAAFDVKKESIIKRVVDAKLALVLAARYSWPMYAQWLRTKHFVIQNGTRSTKANVPSFGITLV